MASDQFLLVEPPKSDSIMLSNIRKLNWFIQKIVKDNNKLNLNYNFSTQVKVSANDTDAGYLNGKIIAGTGITLTENNDGNDETFSISATAHNVLSATHGDTTTSAVLAGDIIRGFGSPAKWVALAGDNTGSQKFLACTSNILSWETVSLSGYLKADGTVPLTAAYDMGDYGVTALNFASIHTVNQSTVPTFDGEQTAQTLQDGSANTGTNYTMATKYIAVKFVASDNHTMGDFEMRIKVDTLLTVLTGTVIGYIFADDGGSPSKPTGSALATGKSILHGTLTTTYQVLSFGTTRNLVSGTTYWLSIAYNQTPTGGNIILDSSVSSNLGATSTTGGTGTWTNTDVNLYYIIRGLTASSGYFSSTNNYGTYGNSINSYGVYGQSTNSYGVYGQSTNSYGVYGQSTNSFGGYFISTSNIGVRCQSTSNYGGYFLSTSHYGGYFSSTSYIAGFFQINPASTNTMVEVLRLERSSSGTAANGIGGCIGFQIEHTGNAPEEAGRIGFILTTATNAAEESAFVVYNRTGGASTREVLRIDSAGNLGIQTTLSASGVTYGDSNVSGSRLHLLASTIQEREVALWTPTWVDNTDASRKGRLTLQVYDTSARTCMIAEGNGSAPMLGFFGSAAIIRPAALTTQLTTLTYTAPGTPDYAIQDFVDVSLGAGWAFANHDEANTVLSTIANLQTRIAELEDKLGHTSGLGLINH